MPRSDSKQLIRLPNFLYYIDNIIVRINSIVSTNNRAIASLHLVPAKGRKIGYIRLPWH